MWSDTLYTAEVAATQEALDTLASIKWAQPLLDRLKKQGGILQKNKPLLFEVRYAFLLSKAGVTAEYEYPTGVGNSTVEFRIHGTPEWFIELVSIQAREAAKRAVRQTGLIYEQSFSSDAKDRAQSEEAEMITAEQKIVEKVFTKGHPTKFPLPTNKRLHAIVADMRGYLDGGGGTRLDYRQMAFGAAGIPQDLSELIHYWKDEKGKLWPIKGLFEESNPLVGARYIQERIHFIGFVCEQNYTPNEIRESSYYLCNWHLFADQKAAIAAFSDYPLKPESKKGSKFYS
jgi:hypothetical protein